MKILFRALCACVLLCLIASGARAQTVVNLSPIPKIQFVGSNGVPLAGGCVFTYTTGTNNPLASYTDSTGVTPNTNPVILDSAGRADIWLQNLSYRIKLVTAGGVNCVTGTQIFQEDGINAVNFLNLVNTWTANQFFTTITSVTANPSTTGFLRLATSDQMCWRNNANTVNLCWSKNALDVLNWGAGLSATTSMSAPFFQSSSANPAASGVIRVASADTVCWRNNANTADVCLNKNAADTLNYPTGINAGVFMSAFYFTTQTVLPATFGIVRLASADQACWRNEANSADLCLSKDATDRLLYNGLPLATGFKIENFNITPVTASNTVAETTLMTFTLSANELAATQALDILARGSFSNSFGANKSCTLKLYLDANVIVSHTVTMATGLTLGWVTHGTYMLVTAGAGGTIEAQGDNFWSGGLFVADSENVVSANGSTFGFDTTATHVIKVTATMNIADPTVSTQQRQMLIERFGP